MDNIITYVVAWCWIIFGKILGSIIFLFIIICIAYLIEKLVTPDIIKEKFKKFTMSYYIDKYILKPKNI